MSARPWIVRMRAFCAHMHGLGWHEHGTFVVFGERFWIIGLPAPWQAFDADNDNGVGP